MAACLSGPTRSPTWDEPCRLQPAELVATLDVGARGFSYSVPPRPELMSGAARGFQLISLEREPVDGQGRHSTHVAVTERGVPWPQPAAPARRGRT